MESYVPTVRPSDDGPRPRRLAILKDVYERRLRRCVGIATLFDRLAVDPAHAPGGEEAARIAGKSPAEFRGAIVRLLGVTWHELVLLHRLSLIGDLWHDQTQKRGAFARAATFPSVRAYEAALAHARGMAAAPCPAVGIRWDRLQFPDWH